MRLAATLLISSVAFAQMNGTPASVTSLAPSTNGPMVTRGVPASVTSLGPQGFTPQQPRIFPEPQPRPHHRDRDIVPVYVPVYGYGYYYDDYYNQRPQQQVVERVVEKEVSPQKLEIVITDKREQEKKAEAEEADRHAAAEPRQSNLSEPTDIPAIFIFKDGTQKELGNFAIMAGTLYDFSDNRIRKIALNTVDREKTLEANAKIGREISLP